MDSIVASLLSLPAMTLATCGSQGPHAATVYFAATPWEENGLASLRLYFFSASDSQHAQDLQGDARLGAAIHPEVSRWQDIHGLQLRGMAHPVPEGPAWEAGWSLYQTRFPFVAALRDVVAANLLYVLTPGWMRLVDNRQGFGFKQEWLREEAS